ncbi:tyrosine-type recombinase/integrase [Microbacterium wangchenii]|nr:tyrosine-type recombinase/integrase [Microbacterium wangchenii]
MDARITVAELAEVWLQDQAAVLKPSSMHALESAWRVRVSPRWGAVPLDSIRYSDVRAWVTELSMERSATTTIRSYGVLAAVLDVAVRDRRIGENPARGIKLPKKSPKRRVYLTHWQVDALAQQSLHPALIYFTAYTGLRWGEATGLRVEDIDIQRRRAFVQDNAVMVNGEIHFGTPKQHRKRSVPYPDFIERLVHLQMHGKRPEQLLFGEGDTHLPLPNSRDGWFAGCCSQMRQGRLTVSANNASRSPTHSRQPRDQRGREREGRTAHAWARLCRDDSGYLRGPLR